MTGTLPPYDPDLDVIMYIEDPYHGPSREKRVSCWLVFWKPCPHKKKAERHE